MSRVLILSNPRSGSSFLQDLLNCHGEVEIAEELLNDEFGLIEDPMAKIESSLGELHKTIVGFKVFPEQIFTHDLRFSELLTTIATSHVIVLWRENILETYCSRCIADSNGEWYTLQKSNKIEKILVDENNFRRYVSRIKSDWKRIGEEWPSEVRPIFIKFEDLISRPDQEVKRVLAELKCNSEHVFFKNTSERQNPAPIHEKVINYDELSAELRSETLDVKTILESSIKRTSLHISCNNELLPDEEPDLPPAGWRYAVAQPYLPAIAMQNVFDAMQSGSISSAGYWPKQLAARVRTLFNCPVAQPCSNGFTALMLAMQTANIGEGDEVIVPTMTMVAVPNAIRYLRGTPVFADNAKNSYNPMWTDYERQATSRTKALIVTHTYGVPASDIEEIQIKCKSRGWILIEDISECVGVMFTTSDGGQRLLGTFGDFSVSSLYANKIVHGGDGGFVIAKEAKYGKRLASIVNHGFTPRFHFVHFEPAINAKIHGIGAAIASGCFDNLEIIMKHRAQLSKWYRNNLRKLPIKMMPKCGPHDTPWVFGIQCESKAERTKLRKFMAKHEIETRDFFFNLHLQPMYFLPQDGLTPQSLPNAEHLGSTGFYLPTHSNLTEKDVQYICDCVKLYFSTDGGDGHDFILSKISSKETSRTCVQVEANGFALTVRKYRNTGELTNLLTRGHVYIEAVKLGIEAESVLMHEKYDDVALLLNNIKACLSEAQGYPLLNEMNNFFLPYIKYFQCQDRLEQPMKRPWLSIDLNDKMYDSPRHIPTTTDTETLQLLVWMLHQQKPEIIWEIGSWMGHATVLMSKVCSYLNVNHHKIFACDAFRWQSWMNEYIPKNTKYVRDSRSFLEVFKENVKSFSHHIEPVVWPYELTDLPSTLKNNRPQMVFLDITQEEDDLEQIWSFIETSLLPNETIILFNGLTNTSLSFFTRHNDQLVPLAKPHTKAKAFRFVHSKFTINNEDAENMMQATVPMKRNLKFYENPTWSHHHNNLFCKSIEILKQHLHSNDEDIIFVPAVEATLCDDIELFYENAWIGIIHGLEHYPELFYTPDLKRLCSNTRYTEALKNCKGLFTLTSFQTDYLNRNLPDFLHKFPIQQIHYPIDVQSINIGGSLLPQLITDEETTVDVIHIGSFVRDFEFFFQLTLPRKFRKVLLVGDEIVRDIAHRAPADVTVLHRLTGNEYEEMLQRSVVFLTLKYEGAANTLILECVARNIPIVSPNISSCTDYLGSDYPLLYDSSKPDEIKNLLVQEKFIDAISYLERMDKIRLSQDKFVSDVKNGAVLLSLPPNPSTTNIASYTYGDTLNYNESSGRTFKRYDVTICICSYKRTHNLLHILDSLWNQQDFNGSYEILIWNNNQNRNGIVKDQTNKYMQQATDKRSMVLINSSENYYCSIRFSLPPLLKSDCVLICDDDIIPGSNFISFFHSAHIRHPEDVLCVRGHKFLAHHLNLENPKNVWMNYDNLKFKDDNQPEQLIHFVHADACLIPKQALREVASVTVPDPTFALVDDYWMSFILSHKFNRKLRKLSVSGIAINPIMRTEDSDQPGLALHTIPEVQDARLRLYVHHMLHGWPKWKVSVLSEEKRMLIEKKKKTFWDHPAQIIGYNIHSEIDQQEVFQLSQIGVKCVRIGAVGVGEKTYFELSGFRTEPEKQLERLDNTITHLRNASIDVIITLERRLASPETWRLIAERFSTFENVIGYDLLNEPFTKLEEKLHWADVETTAMVDPDLNVFAGNMAEMIHSIREVDQYTAIVIEPTSWGRIHGLRKFPIENFLKIDSNLVVSVHFYDPLTLTSRSRNKGQYSFPSSIPWYDDIKFGEETYWDEETVFRQLLKAKTWATEKGVRLFVGEFGICREIEGAPEYLNAVINSCKKLNLIGLLFSYRDPYWDAMDYEFGTNNQNFERIEMCPTDENPFVKIIFEGIAVDEK